MEKYITIEYPSAGATYCNESYGVYEYSEYPESSVLAGQQCRRFLGDFNTQKEAREAYPQAVIVGGSCHIPVNVNHLLDRDGE